MLNKFSIPSARVKERKSILFIMSIQLYVMPWFPHFIPSHRPHNLTQSTGDLAPSSVLCNKVETEKDEEQNNNKFENRRKCFKSSNKA